MDLPEIELHESITGERILPGEPHDEPGDPDQPPGITSDSRRLPPPADAVERVGAFLSDWGDGRIDDGAWPDPPLFARDLEVLRKYAFNARQHDAEVAEVARRVTLAEHGLPSCGFDTEAHAAAYNEGYEAAVTQGLADDPTKAGEWLEKRDAEVAEAAWDEGWNASADYMSDGYDGPDDVLNPYRSGATT